MMAEINNLKSELGIEFIFKKQRRKKTMSTNEREVHDRAEHASRILYGTNEVSFCIFNQSYNNSLEDLENVKLFGENAISVMNPSSERMNTLRSTLHQGLLKNLDFNYRNGSADTLIYEYGTIFSGKATNLGDIDQQNSFSCLVHGDLFSKNVHFDSISASFSLWK